MRTGYGIEPRPGSLEADRDASARDNGNIASSSVGNCSITFDTAPDVLRMTQACDLARVDRGTMTAMINRGTIPAIKSSENGRWLIPKAGLLAALMGEGR